MAGVYPGSESGTCFRSNRSCLLSPAHQGMKSRSCGLVQRIGAADSATPHPDPCGGQAPRLAKSSTALHFLIPPWTIGLQIGTFRRWRAGIEVDWRAHFRSNRSCRLPPAHQGMKWGSGCWNCLQVICHPLPPLWIPAFAGMTIVGRGFPGRARLPRRDVRLLERAGHKATLEAAAFHFRRNRSCRLGLGTPRYEKPELWFGTVNWRGGFCHAPPRPQRGTSPSPREVFDRATFSHSAIDHRSTNRHASPVESRHRG